MSPIHHIRHSSTGWKTGGWNFIKGKSSPSRRLVALSLHADYKSYWMFFSFDGTLNIVCHRYICRVEYAKPHPDVSLLPSLTSTCPDGRERSGCDRKLHWDEIRRPAARFGAQAWPWTDSEGEQCTASLVSRQHMKDFKGAPCLSYLSTCLLSVVLFLSGGCTMDQTLDYNPRFKKRLL